MPDQNRCVLVDKASVNGMQKPSVRMTLSTLRDVLRVSGFRRDEFNSAERRGILVYSVAPSGHGVPRPITPAAALEIGFRAALQRVGFATDEVTEIIPLWVGAALGDLAADSAYKWTPYWIVNPLAVRSKEKLDDLGGRGISDVDASVLSLFAHFAEKVLKPKVKSKNLRDVLPATALTIIDRGAIRDRILSLFADNNL